jgi:hypothetical protein
MTGTTGRPQSDEFSPFYAGYIANVTEIDPIGVMESQGLATQTSLAAISEAQSLLRYAPDKWSIREVVGHLADAERVFAYRAMRIGRSDETPIEGFDENAYVAAARFDRRPLAELADELAAVRRTTLALFRGFEAATWNLRGTANNARVSVRALAFIIPGHERHHVKVLRERYGIGSEQ